MKKTIYLPTLLIILFIIFFGKSTNAQICPLPQASKTLQSNNISTEILNGGDLFWNRSSAQYTSNTNPNVSSIFNAGLWVGGYTGLPMNPNLKIAGATYNSPDSYDYGSGPLSNIGTTNFATCSNYDQLWEVFGNEIAQHIADFNDDGFIANKIQNIYAYPGHQNPHFFDIHNFDLPNTPQGLAPFYDNNGDGIYNPDIGDYPLPSNVHKDKYPAHLIWGIFNDASTYHSTTIGDALRTEIQLTAWAFNCTENEILNNTIFTSHKIIHRNQDPIDSLHLGLFVDFNIGCHTDDYIGCSSDLNTFYAYNQGVTYGTGGICLGLPSYNDNPPVQAITFLNHDMNSFMTTQPVQSAVDGPTMPAHYFELLTGTWPNNIPLTQGGDGYNSGNQNTSFLFDGNPNNVNDWSMASIGNTQGNVKGVGQVAIMDVAYTFYQDATLNNIETVNLVYDNTPLLQQMYDTQFQFGCESVPTNNNDLTTLDIPFEIFPNPAIDLLNVQLENPEAVSFEIFDMYGRVVFEQAESVESYFQLPIQSLSKGVYFLKLKMEGKYAVQKFVKT